MSTQAPKADWIADELVNDVRARLRSGKRVRRTLPDGGRLHIDRQLPFLCLYRRLPGVSERLARLRDGMTVFDLVEGKRI